LILASQDSLTIGRVEFSEEGINTILVCQRQLVTQKAQRPEYDSTVEVHVTRKDPTELQYYFKEEFDKCVARKIMKY